MLRGVATETISYFPEVEKKFPKVREAKYIGALPRVEEKKVEFKTEVKVINADTFDTALNMVGKGLNPLVLNMASYWQPGGGWRKGSMAQEEELFRRSTYAMSLEQPVMRKCYPLLGSACIYSPSVVVFRAGRDQNYALYDWSDCCSLSCLAMPAMRHPHLVDDRLSDEDARLTLEKIRNIFGVARHYGHDSLVLGALGCGAYGNPPTHIAELFKKVIDEYQGQFKQVVFAILTDHNDRYGNLKCFVKQLT